MKARRKWFSIKNKNKTKQNKKQKQNSRDNYLCVIITLSPNRGKNLTGKPNEKNNNKKWRNKNAHDKVAHSNKIK